MTKKLEQSELMNDPDFVDVKDSLLKSNISQNDKDVDFIVDMLEFVNDKAVMNHDLFFYQMMEFIRFPKKKKKRKIAWTDMYHSIYLNCPGIIGESVRDWDFTYAHECLHNLWDTFGVADELIKKFGSYNHKVLNLASDCVINDFLVHVCKKHQNENVLVSPAWILQTFGIKYDRTVDTQYTLYLKLMEAKEQIENNKELENWNNQYDGPDEDDDDDDDDGDDSQQSNGGKGKPKKGNGNDGSEDDGSEDDAGGGGGDGSDGSDDGSDAGSDGGGSDDGSDAGSDGGGKGHGKGKGGETVEEPVDFEKLNKQKEKAEKFMKRFADSVAHGLGQFNKQCRMSKQLKKEGLRIGTPQNTGSGWNEQLVNTAGTFVKKFVFNKMRMKEPTRKRISRRQGIVKPYDYIKKGKRVKKNEVILNLAFYIDTSGSMDRSDVWKIYDTCYLICEAMRKSYRRNRVVTGTEFDIYSFGDNFKKVAYGQKYYSCEGTMPLHKLIDGIYQRTGEYLLNIIITDVEMTIQKADVMKLLDGNDEGMIIMVANKHKPELEKLAKDENYSHKFKFILAPHNWETPKNIKLSDITNVTFIGRDGEDGAEIEL